MRDEMMRMRMMRIARKRRMTTMDEEHNDNDNNDKTTIKRKQGRGTRMRDEETTRMQHHLFVSFLTVSPLH